MSDDPEQEFFSDGISEDIITALSKLRWFFVIARNSSFTYKGRAVHMKQIAEELGVDYLLEAARYSAEAGDRASARRRLNEARGNATAAQSQRVSVLLARLELRAPEEV